MTTNLDLYSQLVERALEIGGYKSKKATVNQALKEFIQRRKQIEILERFGTIVYDPDYHPKAARKT